MIRYGASLVEYRIGQYPLVSKSIFQNDPDVHFVSYAFGPDVGYRQSTWAQWKSSNNANLQCFDKQINWY